jgi:ABC-type polysaccharide/polyol phosphate export permease
VFYKIFKMDPRTYGAYILAGLAFWNYFLAVTMHSCQCFFHGEAYIRQFPTPLAIYPLRTTLGGAFHFVLALGIVIATSWLFHGFGNLLVLPALIPTLLMLLVFGWSMSLIMGFANVYFQDTQHLAEVVSQILFYATPIIYRPDTLGSAKMDFILQINPLTSFLQLIREPILDGRVPDLHTYGMAAITTLLVFGTAVVTLVKGHARLIFRM